ncbi:MAG: motility associated factor glycosyltransferase family protein [Lachnospiraceae bacterium]|nr:motility associated factor glycosyltransferase family protein [Lachnospiraceae bacterium]
MSLYYDKNLEAFRERYPEEYDDLIRGLEKEQRYAVDMAEVEDRSVLFTVQNQARIQLDSLYDSSFIIDKWCTSFDNDCSYRTCIVFGLGNGMFVKELIKRNAGQEYQIIIFEPDTSVLKRVLNDTDISAVISDPNICLYIEGISKKLFTVVLDDHIDLKKLQGRGVNAYPNYRLLYPEEYESFKAAVRMNEMIIEGSMNVEVRYGEKYYNNILSNLPNLMDSYSLESLKTAMPEGFTAVIVSSGPSLSKNIKELGKACGKCLMIAVDSALPPLFAEDIQPDIYMCVDANKPTTHFEEERTKDSAIVTALQSIPGAIKEGQRVFFEGTDNSYINSFLEAQDIELPVISTGGTVANSAYSLAEYLGASVIILTGQDLAYTGEKAHADNNLSDNNAIIEDTIVETVDIYGKPIRSSQEFMIYKDWFERRIAENREHIKTIDATEGGAYIEGSEVMTLREAIDNYCSANNNIHSAVNDSKKLFSEAQREGFDAHIKALPAELRNVMGDAGRSIRNYDRMYAMAKTNNLSKGELTRLLRENDRISERLYNAPAMSFVELLIQDAIKNLSENAYKTNKNVKDEIIEASTLGKEHSEAILEKAEWIIEDFKTRGINV